MKTRNGPKKWGNGPIKRGNRSTNWEFKTFFWKPETDPKKEETDPKKSGNRSTNWEFTTFSENRKLTQKKRGNRPKKKGNKSNVNIAETHPKYSEIPLHFLVFEGFPIILEKKKEMDPNSLLSPFPCWGVSTAPIYCHHTDSKDYHYPLWKMKAMVLDP